MDSITKYVQSKKIGILLVGSLQPCQYIKSIFSQLLFVTSIVCSWSRIVYWKSKPLSSIFHPTFQYRQIFLIFSHTSNCQHSLACMKREFYIQKGRVPNSIKQQRFIGNPSFVGFCYSILRRHVPIAGFSRLLVLQKNTHASVPADTDKGLKLLFCLLLGNLFD